MLNPGAQEFVAPTFRPGGGGFGAPPPPPPRPPPEEELDSSVLQVSELLARLLQGSKDDPAELGYTVAVVGVSALEKVKVGSKGGGKAWEAWRGVSCHRAFCVADCAWRV